jgi:nucleoid DNA-binding protein
MIPKKPNILYKEIAEENDISENLVDALIGFYYKDVRKELSGLTHTRVNIDGLGQFVVKARTVDALILKCERIIAKTDNYKFSSYFNKKRLESKLEDLRAIKVKLDADKEKKQEFLKEKNERKASNNLEE